MPAPEPRPEPSDDATQNSNTAAPLQQPEDTMQSGEWTILGVGVAGIFIAVLLCALCRCRQKNRVAPAMAGVDVQSKYLDRDVESEAATSRAAHDVGRRADPSAGGPSNLDRSASIGKFERALPPIEECFPQTDLVTVQSAATGTNMLPTEVVGAITAASSYAPSSH